MIRPFASARAGSTMTAPSIPKTSSRSFIAATIREARAVSSREFETTPLVERWQRRFDQWRQCGGDHARAFDVVVDVVLEETAMFLDARAKQGRHVEELHFGAADERAHEAIERSIATAGVAA